MSFKSPSPPSGGKVKPFGPNNELLYTLSDVRGGQSRVGAVLWGLGIAEIKIARTLAKKGIVSLQIRINGDEFYDDARRNEIYRQSGVDYCKLAMDKLAAERGVTSFILMGNCACANLCFHAAVRDTRVVGLILTNPYIARGQLLRTTLFRKLAKPAVWTRLRTDVPVRFRAGFRAVPRLIAGRIGLGHSHEGNQSRTAPRQSLELPEKFSAVLREICDRGLKVLVACTASDDSLHYLSRRYGKDFRTLEAQGSLRFTSVASAAHVFSQDDDAAGLLNDAIADWIQATTLSAVPVTESSAYGFSDDPRESFGHT
jgi:hypothetical protein